MGTGVPQGRFRNTGRNKYALPQAILVQITPKWDPKSENGIPNLKVCRSVFHIIFHTSLTLSPIVLGQLLESLCELFGHLRISVRGFG